MKEFLATGDESLLHHVHHGSGRSASSSNAPHIIEMQKKIEELQRLTKMRDENNHGALVGGLGGFDGKISAEKWILEKCTELSLPVPGDTYVK
eukprot:3697664-Karenia_brevis.AAC.1